MGWDLAVSATTRWAAARGSARSVPPFSKHTLCPRVQAPFLLSHNTVVWVTDSQASTFDLFVYFYLFYFFIFFDLFI